MSGTDSKSHTSHLAGDSVTTKNGGSAKPAARFKAKFNTLEWYRENVPCMEACPVNTDAGRYVQLIAEGRYRDAFLVARSPNPMASMCGRICAAPCEDACRRGSIDKPVTIRSLKRFVTERFGAESAKPDEFRRLLKEETDIGSHRAWHLPQLRGKAGSAAGKKVAIVGAGPAGIGCAHDLALLGYKVTIIEALEHAGGMVRYGVPDYRLPRAVLEREVDAVLKLGVEFRGGVRLTPSYNLESLRNEGFEAVFLSVGAMQGRDLNIPGHDKDGVLKAVDYLLNLNRGYSTDLGDKVVVIGGGSVALDAARSAVREFYQPMEEIERTAEAVVHTPALDAARGAIRGGASEVHVVSLESLAELPAARTIQGLEEMEATEQEGIQFHPSWGPKVIQGNGRVTGIDLVAVTRVFDENGRFNPTFDESRTLHIEATSVILAIGQSSDLDFIAEKDGIELTRGGTIKIDSKTLATTASGIFAGGDVAFGPRIAIEAVSNGKLAARSIHAFLAGERSSPKLTVEIDKVPIEEYRMPQGYDRSRRCSPPTIDLERRTGVTEVEEVFGEETAREQAARCLACHVDTIYDPEICVLCGRCADVCPERCLKFVPIEEVEMPEDHRQQAFDQCGLNNEQELTVLLKDDTACIRCGLCALRCPTEAMTMERFRFEEVA